ncbi:MAG TPA: YcaO-like family protein [Pyrinomonadaceae bacterium]|nr:YcaO-like family protein [Pyrinomonadaceae bacterium]
MVSSSARSMRILAPETTLLYAKQLAATAGISEVRDITDLDILQVPVFVSVRPQARADSFTFGKGLRPVDAEVGAYMEALEFFFAEPGRGCVATHWGSARDVAGQEHADDAILDFVPLLQREIDLDGSLLLASAKNLESGDECVIPAELIFYPAPDVGQSLFGSSTNGLASGNSLLEATVQALLELIERDIWSFEFIRGASKLVEAASLPDDVREIVERAERHGLQLKVRTIPNDYGMPFFAAFLFDLNNPSRQTFNGGWACDLDRDRAVVRAVTEAAQSRVAFIHGGRKVPTSRATGFTLEDLQREAKLVRQHMLGVSDPRQQMLLTDIPDVAVAGTLQEKLDTVIERLRRVSQKPIYRAVFTPPESPLQVVRVVVPLLESLKENRVRVGRRLKAAIDAAGVQAA